MHDRARGRVQPHTGHGCRRVDARLLQEPHVQRHASDIGGCHAVDERRRHLRLGIGDERKMVGDTSRRRDRRRDVCHE